MIRRGAQQYPGYQEPINLPVVYWEERVGGWWPGVATRCPDCNGRMDADPESAIAEGPGRVFCISCSRDVADVLDRRPVTFNPADHPPERRGRPPRAQLIADEHLCPDCKTRRIRPLRRRCDPCAATRVVPSNYYVRLVGVLEATETPLRCREIASLVGCALDTVRHLIQLARLRGVPVVTEGRRYWIVEVAA